MPLSGWTATETVDATGLHPAATQSSVLNAVGTTVFGTLLLWKKSGERWTTRELLPVTRIAAADAAGPITIILANGQQRLIRY